MTGVHYIVDAFVFHFSGISTTMKMNMMSYIFTFCLLASLYSVDAGLVGLTMKGLKRRKDAYMKCCDKIKCFYPKYCSVQIMLPNKCECVSLH